MKKRTVAKDPDDVQNELLRKDEEVRQLKRRLNELSEEHKKVKTSAVRLEKLAKRGGEEDGTMSGTLLNPRDAASMSNMVDSQKKLLEEKERQIKSLLAGSRLEGMGARKLGSSNPAAIYGIKRPAKKTLGSSTSRPTSAASSMRKVMSPPPAAAVEPISRISSSSSRSSLHSGRGGGGSVTEDGVPLEAQDLEDYQDEPDFQPSNRPPSSASLSRAPSSKRASPPMSPARTQRASGYEDRGRGGGAAGGGAGGIENQSDHYLQFNKRLQERLNSSQSMHRNSLAMDGGAGAAGDGGGDDGGAGPTSFAEDDAAYGGGGGGGGGSGGGDMSELVWIRRELRQKKAKIASLQSHFDHLTVSFRVEKDLQKMTLAQCEELKQSVATLQARERGYQRQLEALEDHRLQLENQSSIITDLQSDKRALEDRISQLHTNLFAGDTTEQLRHKQLLNEHQSSVMKLNAELEEKDRAIKALKSTNVGLVERTQLNEQLLRDKRDLEQENRGLRDKCVELTEKLVVFSVDSGVEVEDLERALDIVRRQREDGPSRVSFLNNNGDEKEDASELDTVPGLRRKFAALELKSRDYILEIQQKTDMLNTQYTINKEQKKRLLEATKKLTGLQVEVERLRYELTHRPAAAALDGMSDSIFAMSEDGDGILAADQLTGLENLIAFRVVSATLRADSGFFGGSEVASPLTFLTAEFYEFESSFSEVFGGFTPAFNFTTQYQVDADQFLVHYLENEELVLTLYQQLQGTEHRKIATCYIPLSGLLSPAAAIEGRAQLLHTASSSSGGVRGSLRDGSEEDTSEVEKRLLRSGRLPSESIVGEIRYVMRMKRPILSTPPSPASTAPSTPRGGPSMARAKQTNIITSSMHQPVQNLFQAQPSHQQQQYASFQPTQGTIGGLRDYGSRDLNAPQPQSRATISTSADSGSPNLRPTQQQSSIGARPSQQAAGGSSSFLPRQPSSSSSTNTNTLNRGSQLSMDDFDHATTTTQPVSQFGMQRQQQQPVSQSTWDPSSLPHPPSSNLPPRGQLRPSASRVSSGVRTAEQEQRDIEDLLNNPDSQDALFDNDLNSDRGTGEESF